MFARHNAVTFKLCCAGLLLAAGVLLPQVFHLAGGQTMGGLFLPMHLPVLLAGLLLGPSYGAVLGISTPLISFLLTGMPPAARLPFMLVEMTVYGLCAGWFTRLFSSRRFGLYYGLVLAQLAGRTAYLISLFVGAFFVRLPLPPLQTVAAATLTGLPGIALQLAVIPPMVYLIKKVTRFDAAA